MKLESLQSVILAVAQARSVDMVLKMIVEGLAEQRHVALARLWLAAPGDICESCRMRTECPDQTRCLHLMASDGNPSDKGENWSRLDGDFRRFPLNVRKIGRIGASGEPVLLNDITEDKAWIARPDWVAKEHICSFAAQPLVFRNEILGVLAIFCRSELGEQEFRWLRTFADHASVAIANARAFEEIGHLREQLELENSYLREEVRAALAFGEIIGQSPALQKVLRQIELVAPTNASVLILGETGTGKELVARAIHERSRRNAKPIIKVNCSSVPRELFESEFFGHVKGAFTGALKDRSGRFQLADGGTLFLDEVGEIPLDLQSKLLRVLQDGQFERVGEDRTSQTDVRLIAATNRDLNEEVDAGRFRQDLYYRLSVFPIELPSLGERKEDIPLLARHFFEQACKRLNCGRVRLTQTDVDQLQSYHWPGNVRELQNVVERTVIVSQGGRLRLDLVFPHRAAEPHPSCPGSKASTSSSAYVSEYDWKQRERENLLAALKQAGGKIYGPSGAAELLGIKPTTLAYRLRAAGIRKAGETGP